MTLECGESGPEIEMQESSAGLFEVERLGGITSARGAVEGEKGRGRSSEALREAEFG